MLIAWAHRVEVASLLAPRQSQEVGRPRLLQWKLKFQLHSADLE